MIIIIFFTLFAAYIVPNNNPPWNSFQSEFFAILFAIILGFINIREKTKISSYHTFILALIVAAGCWTLATKGSYKTYFFIGSLYLLSSILAFDYANSRKNKISIDCFFFSLILSSLISLGFQLAQFFDITDYFFPWILEAPPGNRFFANFGQPNQLASLICISFLGSLYLLHRSKISNSIQIIITICFSISLALAGSKTSILALVVSMFFLFTLRKEDKKYILHTASLFLLFFLIKLAIPAATRDYSSTEISNGRIAMWQMLAQAILEKPLQGYGFNNTIAANFNVIGEFPESWHKITAHAHNLFLDFAIWFGLPVGIGFSIFFIWIAYTIIIKQQTVEKKLLAYTIIPLIIHANLEFPLHYAYFLIPFGFIAGAAWPGKFFYESFYVHKIFLVICVFLGTLVTKEYFLLETSLREQRFYLQNFKNSEIQKEIVPFVLDLPTAQYNFLVKKKITEKEIEAMKNLVELYPTYRNFYFLCNYFLERKEYADFNYFYSKAINILPSNQASNFERTFKTNKDF